MRSLIKKVVWSEPSGWPTAVIMFSGSLVFLSIYVYSAVVWDTAGISELFLSAGAALSGLAESRPSEQRLTAGILRLTAVLFPITLILLLVAAPEVVISR